MTISDERLAELIESRKIECNRLSYGACQTLACLKRGGYISGPPRYDVATCDEHEISIALRELQQRRAQDRSMGDSSGKISDNDGHSLRKREESMDGESPTQQTDLAEQYVNICAVCATAFGRPTKREVICPACNPAQQAQPDKSVGILPCPCCGYRAELEQVPHAPEEPNASGYYIECKRAGCGLTTRLAFSCKADAVPGLVAAWNRRPLAAPPQQDEVRELLREASDELDYQTSNDHPMVARIRAYLARTGGKEEK